MSTILCDILLVIAAIMTLPLIPLARGNRRLAGPDRAGAAIGYFFVCIPRWTALAIVLSILAARNEFAWITAEPVPAWLVVIITHVCIGVFTMTSIMMAEDRGRSGPWTNLALIPPIAVPLLVVAYCATLLHSDANPLGMRIILIICAVPAWIGCGIWGVMLVRERMKKLEADNQRAWEQEDERTKERAAAFDALPPDAPFGELLRYGGLGESDALHAKVIAAVTSRPNHLEGIAASLRNEWRGEAMRYVRFSMDPPMPAALAPAAFDALMAQAESIRKTATPIVYTHNDDYDWDCFAAVEIADKFANLGVNFRPAVQSLLDGLEASPNKDIAIRGKRSLQEWLKLHPA